MMEGGEKQEVAVQEVERKICVKDQYDPYGKSDRTESNSSTL